MDVRTGIWNIPGLLMVAVASVAVPATAQNAINTADKLSARPSPGGEASRQTAMGSLRGVTIAPGGFSLAAVTVVVQSLAGSMERHVMSDTEGVFRVDDIPAGNYKITASKEGFTSPPPTMVQVAENKTTNASVQLTQGAFGTLRGVTSAAGGFSLAAVSVLVRSVSGATERKLLSDGDGVFTVKELPPGSYQVSASKDGFSSPPAVNIEIAQDRTSNANIQLAQAATPVAQSVAPQGSPAPPEAPPAVDMQTPFADYDWTWLNGNPRNKDVAFDSKFFTPEIRGDVTYTYDFNRPIDDSMGGSSELFRSNEIQLEQLGIGGDFHWDNVRARFMTQFGEYSTATIRNDPSYAKGQWDLADADRYLSEAYAGYHINALHGINIDAGIFMSYIGLFSYYNFDNWAYQPSYVSSNTPWFFQGIRIQIFPTHHLKIEPWIINGWQSYASANSRKGLGGQIKYTPFQWLNIVSNEYGLGHDDLYTPHRGRIHTDNSFEVKYYDKPSKTLDKMAFTFTGDLGCEFGQGVSCYTDKKGGPKQSFVGFMLYNKLWFDHDLFGSTLGGGMINNPGRYLVLIPPINGETAASSAINSPYFTFNPGDPFKAWDVSHTFDYMPRQWLTFRLEGDFRHANVPYWSGHGGVTPPPGTNNGYPTEYACMDGTPSVTATGCGNDGGLWSPDLRKREWLIDIDVLVKF
jgi:hypothetical protein